MKILVIGGLGYIGSHVVKELLKRKNSVTVFDNLSSGLEQNLLNQTEFIKGDILDSAKVNETFNKGFDAFIHLAAFKAAGESMTNPQKYSVNNICGTINLLNAASKNNCKYMVFSSSAAIFGEPQYLPIDEAHPKEPINYYGFTKLEIERFMAWYEKLCGLHYASLRYFNAAGYDIDGELYGLEQNPANLLPIVMETAFGKRKEMQIYGTDYNTRDGTCIRDYVHVSDLALAHALALDYITKNDKSICVNLGSEKGVSVKEMLIAARNITKKNITAVPVARRAGDPASLYATSALAHEALGWKAVYSDVDTLIRTTFNAYKKYYDAHKE